MVSFDQVLIFKKDIMERFGLSLHFHDGCGGQYFSFDEPAGDRAGEIAAYFAEKGFKAAFSEDLTILTLRD